MDCVQCLTLRTAHSRPSVSVRLLRDSWNSFIECREVRGMYTCTQHHAYLLALARSFSCMIIKNRSSALPCTRPGAMPVVGERGMNSGCSGMVAMVGTWYLIACDQWITRMHRP